MTGTRIGPYTIVRELGRGGMGVVYLARDTRLDRDVAVKALPDHLAHDPDRLARFEREAKIVAQLNHPNIAGIYALEEYEDKKYLVMEYVEGDTLAERLERGALPVDEALGLAGQIAAGVEAAHEAGVIHRDLKPGNVIVTPDGEAKVLDFGLARAEELSSTSALSMSPDSPTITTPPAQHSPTMPGVILGTAAYMSPEQARGRKVDKRTDIWSFGVVLYEMLTGASPFVGETVSDSIGAVLHKEVDFGKLLADTPAAVRQLIKRCLRRDPHARLRDIGDARLELVTTRDGESDAPDNIGIDTSRRYRGLPWTAAIAIGVVAAFLGAFVVLQWPPSFGQPAAHSEASPLADAIFSKLTDFPGTEMDPAISSDGRFVTFVSDRDGPFDVFVGQVDAGEFRNVTSGLPEFALWDVLSPVRNVGFTGNGSEIWLGGGTGSRFRSMPIMGGALRNLLGPDVVSANWSTDGGKLVYHENGEGDPTYVADHDGTNRRLILPSPKGMHQHYPIWSLNGQWIYLVRGRPATLEMDLWRVRPDGTQSERLTYDKLDVQYPTPIDARTVLYIALDMDGAGPWMWALDVESGASRRAAVGLEQYTSVASDAQGQRLVATIANPVAALWSVPILPTVATEKDAKPLDATKGRRAAAPRIRGDALYFLSSRSSGRNGLWRHQNGKVEEIWRGSETTLLEPGAIAPDGSKIAIVLRRDGGRRIYLLAADGSQLTALSKTLDAQGTASWSPDGKWIATGGRQSGEVGLFKISVDGRVIDRLVEGEAINPIWSPRGDLIAYAGAQVEAQTPLLGVRPDGQPVALPEIRMWHHGERARFLPDGSGIVYMQGFAPSQDFWLLDLATMERRALTQLDSRAKMRTFDVTANGTRIVFDRLSDNSDIVLIERRNTD